MTIMQSVFEFLAERKERKIRGKFLGLYMDSIGDITSRNRDRNKQAWNQRIKRKSQYEIAKRTVA